MNARPLISIIIPVYNVESFLQQCVDSVVNQTYKNLEIILLNDGSTDRSGSMCDEYASSESRIVVIHKQNGGLSETRNYGLNICKGDYLTFIDSDDIIHPQFVEVLFNQIYNADISMCKFLKFADLQILKPLRKSNTKKFSGEEMNYLLYDKDYADLAVIACCKLYKKSMWNDLRYPVGKLHEDVYMAHLIYEKATQVVFTDLQLYFYRVRSGSITSTFNWKNQKDIMEALQLRALYFKRRSNKVLYLKANTSRVSILLRREIDNDNDDWKSYSLKSIVLDDVVWRTKVQLLVKKIFPSLYKLYRNTRDVS